MSNKTFRIFLFGGFVAAILFSGTRATDAHGDHISIAHALVDYLEAQAR